MSLLKQLLISLSLAILIILVSTLWGSMNSARNYLNHQLQTQADSAATSLALTLSQPANQDTVSQELIITALFDSGQFKTIQFSSPTGEVMVQRGVDRPTQGAAPGWFKRLFPVVIAEGGAHVSDGWRQVGDVLLKADATYAQDNLWGSFIRLVGWILAAGVMWAICVLFLMRWLRKQLQEEVVQQLLNIDADSKTAPLSKKPIFSELSVVTDALLTARKHVLATKEEQDAKIEELELELNQDEVTQLANRKYFINELRRSLERTDTESGWLILFRQRDLAEINRMMLRNNVDEWLQSMSQQITAVLQQSSLHALITFARLNGSDFVVLVRNADQAQVQQLVVSISDVLRNQRVQLLSGGFCRWAIAQTDYKSGQFLGQVMSRLDQALMRAESAGHNQAELLQVGAAPIPPSIFSGGETQWRVLLHDAIQTNQFSLQTESVVGHESWHQATLVLVSPLHDAPLTAYQFMPVATRLGLSGLCDVHGLELALRWLEDQPKARLIIRMSLSSVVQATFRIHVANLLAEAAPHVVARLCIELDAFALVEEPDEITEFGQLLSKHGAQLGVRRVIQMPRVLLLFRSIQVNYIRLSIKELNDLADQPEGNVLLRALLQVCQQLSLYVVFNDADTAMSVSARSMLQEYGIAIGDMHL